MRARQHRLSSCFGPKIDEYIQLMRHLGRVFRVEEGHLYNFDAFCVKRQHQGVLTQQLALDFAYAVQDVAPQQHARRYGIIRGFANFLANYEPQTESLDPHAVVARPRRASSPSSAR